MAPSGGVLVLLLLIPAHCFAQEILHAPESTTVFLNQPAVFTCETTGGITSWSVNGTQREILLPEIRVDLVVSENTTPEGTTVQNLTIPARAQYNGTRIQCQSGLFGGSSVESDNATLTIQGTPSEVGDLRTISNASSVTISWSAPFSLNVTGVDPDIWYSVLIYNVTDENNPTAILCTDCINITETHYTFTPDYLSPCHVYNFSVIPLNGAGQGERSPNITGYVLNVSALIKTHIRAISRNETNVTFTSNPTSELCSSWRVTPDVVDDRVIEEPPSPEGPDVTYQLLADNRYSFLVSLPNATDEVAHPRINFTTYDVQSAAADTTKGTDNGFTFTGEFIESTTAQGCFIVLESEYGNPDVFRALLLPDDSSTYVQSIIDNILSSTYHVFVYDLEEDGLPSSHPAVEQSTTVTVMGTSPIADAESQFLNNGSVDWNETAVKVNCKFKECIERASCVLVYREYGNKTLVVEEYPQNTVFPVTLTVGADLEKYTFAIFGKNGSRVDERPIIAIRVDVTETTETTITVSTSSDGRVSAIAIRVSAVSSFIIIIAIGAVVVLIWWKKSHKGGYSFSGVVHGCFCCSSPSETNDLELCSNASVRSGSRLISDDGGAKQKKDGHAEGEAKLDQRQDSGISVRNPLEGEAKPPRSLSSSLDSGINFSTPPVMSKQKGMYTDVKPSTSGVQPPIPEDTRVQYQEIDIRTTHKMALSPYAELGPIPTKRPKPPKIETKTQGPYVDVLPHATTPVTGNDNRGPPTVESVMSLLWGVRPRWKEIAEGLEFDEDRIDEIDTNDTDEGRLHHCVEMWVFKLQPSWEKLSHVLKELGEVELARQAWSEEHIQQSPRKLSDATSGIGTGCDVSPALPRFGDGDSGGGEGVTGGEGEVDPQRQTTFPKGDKASYNFTLQGKNPLFNILLTPVEHSSGEQMCNSDDAGFDESVVVESGRKDWHPEFVFPQTLGPSYDSSTRAEERGSYEGGVEVDQKPHVENFYQTTTSIGTANIEAEDVVVNENICDGTTVECTESSSTKANNAVMVTGQMQERHRWPVADLPNIQPQPAGLSKRQPKHTPPLPKFRAQTLQESHPRYPTHKNSSNSHAVDLTLTLQWMDLRLGLGFGFEEHPTFESSAWTQPS